MEQSGLFYQPVPEPVSSRARWFFGWLLSQFSWQTVAFVSTGFVLIIYAICRLYLIDRPAAAISSDGQSEFIPLEPHPP